MFLYQVLSLTGDLQSTKMEYQGVDSKFKDTVSISSWLADWWAGGWLAGWLGGWVAGWLPSSLPFFLTI